MPGRKAIPLSMPDLRGNEEAYVVEALRSTWISSSGRFVELFEQTFSRLCDVQSTVAVSNGTVALHVALVALGVGPGDAVLVPSLTYVASVNAVRYVGAEPIFVDVSPASLTIDPAQLETKITPNTKGIIAVHLYGHPADMDEINRIAQLYGIWVIEDAAQAHFARYKGRTVGSLGRAATFSFFGNKIITSGEGGAVTTRDPELAYSLRILRGQGMDPSRRYFFPRVGYNYRLSNLACAILCAQLERADAILAERRRVCRRYQEALAGISGISPLPVAPWAEPSPWLFTITVDQERYGLSRDELAQRLAEEGIETRPIFSPVHRLPPYRDLARKQKAELPVTEAFSSTGLSLPTFPALADEEINCIAEVIRKANQS